MARRYELLSNAGAGNGTAYNVAPGGWHQLSCVATFGGGSVKLQTLGPDGSTYVDYQGAIFEAAGSMAVWLPNGSSVRGVAATASAVYLTLVGEK